MKLRLSVLLALILATALALNAQTPVWGNPQTQGNITVTPQKYTFPFHDLACVWLMIEDTGQNADGYQVTVVYQLNGKITTKTSEVDRIKAERPYDFGGNGPRLWFQAGDDIKILAVTVIERPAAKTFSYL